MDTKEKAVEIFESTLSDIHPSRLLPNILSWDGASRKLKIADLSFDVAEDQGIYIIGMGKASASMAAALENILNGAVSGGMVIAPPGVSDTPTHVKTLEGSHPLPDLKSVSSSQKLLQFMGTIPEGSLVLNVVSGGTSALFCVPADNLAIEEIQKVFSLLIESGATIQEINTVRKSISAVKGGRLLNHLRHTTLVDLMISDIPDDDKRYIGSGPTIAQEISYDESIRILQEYSLWKQISKPIQQYLSARRKHEEKEETPFFSQDFDSHHSLILMSAIKMAQSAADRLEQAEFNVQVSYEPWTGSIEAFINRLLSDINHTLEKGGGPNALVYFGECTVNVTGDGLGGRNQELVLRMAKHLAVYDEEIVFLSAGSDGIDGPTDAAGAVADQNSVHEARQLKLDPDVFLQSSDSYNFFKKAGGHVITGPTGNNLMDLQIVLIP